MTSVQWFESDLLLSYMGTADQQRLHKPRHMFSGMKCHYRHIVLIAWTAASCIQVCCECFR